MKPVFIIGSRIIENRIIIQNSNSKRCCFISIGFSTEIMPRMPILKILLPMILPIIIPDSLFSAAITDVVSSGREVPIATAVIPIRA